MTDTCKVWLFIDKVASGYFYKLESVLQSDNIWTWLLANCENVFYATAKLSGLQSLWNFNAIIIYNAVWTIQCYEGNLTVHGFHQHISEDCVATFLNNPKNVSLLLY